MKKAMRLDRVYSTKKSVRMVPTETKGNDLDTPETQGLSCPFCGMPEREWSSHGQGYTKDDRRYCCKGCADGTGCTCR